PALDREGLSVALRQFLEQMHQDHGITYRLRDELTEEPTPEARVILYRIAQEAMANVRRHARATTVHVTLSRREDGTLVAVRDDGRGFDVEDGGGSPQGHLGVTAMRERAQLAGGWCRLRSEPGRGTTVEFWSPHSPA